MKFIEINLTNGQKAVIEPFSITSVVADVTGGTIIRLSSGESYGIHESIDSFKKRADIETVRAPKEKKK